MSSCKMFSAGYWILTYNITLKIYIRVIYFNSRKKFGIVGNLDLKIITYPNMTFNIFSQPTGSFVGWYLDAYSSNVGIK